MGPVSFLFLLALIQGVCEFLPVSSSGHLVIAQSLLPGMQEPVITSVVLHVGTLAAVIAYFFGDLKNLTVQFYERDNLRMWGWLVLASLPTAVIGFAFKERLESLFTQPRAVGVAFMITAVVLLLSRFLRLKAIPMTAAVLTIGVIQGLAIVPGLSRSGLTIAAALILGLGEAFAFRFSFLLSLPAVLGAALLEWRHISWPGADGWLLAAAAVLSAVVGFLALRLLKKTLLRNHFHRFAYYCLLAGMAAFLFFR